MEVSVLTLHMVDYRKKLLVWKNSNSQRGNVNAAVYYYTMSCYQLSCWSTFSLQTKQIGTNSICKWQYSNRNPALQATVVAIC